MTLPPRAWIVAMSLPKVDFAIGWAGRPFQYAEHEPAASVCRKAIVRYLFPDAAASAAGLSPVHASKYGAATRSGMGGTRCVALAPPPPSPTSPADKAVTAAQDNDARRGPGRLIDAPMLRGEKPPLTGTNSDHIWTRPIPCQGS